MDDIKRGPGGIREIEFLAQCFQILRGGREPSLQTPSLDQALEHIESLELMSGEAVAGITYTCADWKTGSRPCATNRHTACHRVRTSIASRRGWVRKARKP